jgi:uncharacterized protein (TIGR00266 family)
MDVTTRMGPAFAVANIMLNPGESVQVEAGAMMAMSAGVTLAATMERGMIRSAKRAVLGGESFFVTTATAPAHGGFIDVAARLPGDITTHRLREGRALCIQKGSWVASATTVTVNTRWAGFRNLFGSEGGFLIRAEGHGPVIVACYGALETWDLEPGQTLTVDTGHMVAYEDTLTVGLRKATGGVVQMFKSGEGIVFDFTGPGRLMTQTRNPNELLGWITGALANGGGPVRRWSGLFTRD